MAGLAGYRESSLYLRHVLGFHEPPGAGEQVRHDLRWGAEECRSRRSHRARRPEPPPRPRLLVVAPNNINYDFGISEAQADKRFELYNNHDSRLDVKDLGTFRGSGGIRDISASANAIYKISNNLNMITNFNCKYLTPKISESPLVRNKASLSISTGLLYRF